MKFSKINKIELEDLNSLPSGMLTLTKIPNAKIEPEIIPKNYLSVTKFKSYEFYMQKILSKLENLN